MSNYKENSLIHVKLLISFSDKQRLDAVVSSVLEMLDKHEAIKKNKGFIVRVVFNIGFDKPTDELAEAVYNSILNNINNTNNNANIS